MKKRNVLAGILAGSMIFSLAACGGAAQSGSAGEPEKVVLKLSTVKSSDSYPVKFANELAEKVKSQTDGQIEIQVYADGQLGGQTELVTGLQAGTIDMSYFSVQGMESIFPEVCLLGTFFTLQSEDGAEKVWNSDFGQKIISEDLREQCGIRTFDCTFEGYREIFTKTPIDSYDQLSGLKLRVPEVPMLTASFSALGTNPTSMSTGDVYTSLQTGVIDGLDMDIDGFRSNKLYEQCKYIFMSNHALTMSTFMINENKFQSLSSEQQEILTNCINETCADMREYYKNYKEETLKFFEDNGVTITIPSDAEQQKALELVRSVSVDYIKDFGDASTLEEIVKIQNS